MLKNLSLFLVILIVGIIGWYLFIKKYDYTINVRVDNRISQVFYEAGDERNFGFDQSNDTIIKISSEEFKNLNQHIIRANQTDLKLNWEFEMKDSLSTRVTLNFNSDQDQLKNRLQILNPFVKSEIVDSVKTYLTRFAKSVKNKSEIYNFQIAQDITETSEKICICTNSEEIPASQKAIEMLQKMDILEDFFIKNKLQRDGFPFVKVKSWNRDTDLINFNFCYPIVASDSLMENDHIEIKKFQAEKSIKADYYGNYRMSNLVWQEIIYRSEKSGQKIKLEPLEVFFNNPNMDPDYSNWKAEIFMPLK